MLFKKLYIYILTLHMLCEHFVVIGSKTISWQHMHKNVSSTLSKNAYTKIENSMIYLYK